MNLSIDYKPFKKNHYITLELKVDFKVIGWQKDSLHWMIELKNGLLGNWMKRGGIVTKTNCANLFALFPRKKIAAVINFCEQTDTFWVKVGNIFANILAKNDDKNHTDPRHRVGNETAKSFRRRFIASN
jgi:hypothetical protein